MNQILSTNLKDIKKKKSYTSKKINIINFTNYSKTISYKQLSILLFFLFSILIIYFFYSYYSINNTPNYITNNYKISKLYSDNSNSISSISSEYIGELSIPKLELSYVVFSNYTDELLGISLCRFYGSSPDIPSNLCIVGHNYENFEFFSNISNLEMNDEILFIDNNDTIYKYIVFNNYEVLDSDFTPIYDSTFDYELTLITCNNQNGKRIIIKAYKEF